MNFIKYLFLAVGFCLGMSFDHLLINVVGLAFAGIAVFALTTKESKDEFNI